MTPRPRMWPTLARFLASGESRCVNGEVIYVAEGATWARSKSSDDQRYPRPVNWSARVA